MGADYKHDGLHALCHTLGSKALTNGKIDIKIESELLGHSGISIIYNKYIHILKEQKAQAIQLLESCNNDHFFGHKTNGLGKI